MAKNINIHIKTKGAQETKQHLNEVGRSAEQTGGQVEGMGGKAQKSTGRISAALGKIVAGFGAAGIAGIVAAAAVKVGKFFDNIKTAADEAVKKVEELRSAYASLYEALSAFDEKSRKMVVKETNRFLQEARVSQEIGLPIINAYTRQFRGLVQSGQLTEEQYQTGLRGMLGYGERHGGTATVDLIAMMAGWGMKTPEQQGAFRRQIATAAAASGLTDADVIQALGRAMPTIKAMNWTPEQAVESIAALAYGETGRKKMSLPATTLQGLLAPQVTKAVEYGISQEEAENPRRLYERLSMLREGMDQQKFTRMLIDIYGTEAASGVFKLMAAPRKGLRGLLQEAAGPQGAAKEAQEEAARRETLEGREAATQAKKKDIDLDITSAEEYMEDVRQVGEAKRKQLRRREPVRQYLREITQFQNEEKEYAAYRAWRDSLSEAEREQIKNERNWMGRDPLSWKWKEMTPQQKWEALMRSSFRTDDEGGKVPAGEQQQPERQQPVSQGSSVTYRISHDMHFYPTVGTDEDRLIGPRTPVMIT